ncbi:MAG: helix-turn-helix transcriptional regulator [Rhodospirillales bacterium]|nr:helix-turn-helix transcriptional regulator [Rhodospirillales bacterium]
MSRMVRLEPAASAAARREIFDSASRGELGWSEAVRRMRLSLGKSQGEFGRLFGLTRRQVQEIETGKANPTIETLARLGKPFGLAVGFIPRNELKQKGRAP